MATELSEVAAPGDGPVNRGRRPSRGYRGIFQADGPRLNADEIYREFSQYVDRRLRPLNDTDVGWSGITVYGGQENDNDLDELPVLRAALEEISFDDVTAVRFTKMEPQGQLHRHRDMEGNSILGQSRLHIALETNPGAYLEVQKQRYYLGKGELWCFDTSSLHAAANDGDEDRVHLIVDVKRSERTERFFQPQTAALRLHQGYFALIMVQKVVRDALGRPRTLLKRIAYLRDKALAS